MRIGFGAISRAAPEFLTFAAQLGATDLIVGGGILPPVNGRWELKDLVKLRLSVEQHGLHLEAIENVPTEFYQDVMLGGPRRDEQIENCINETVTGGWHFDGIQFAMRDSSKRPAMAFLLFTREEEPEA